jgi:predicted lipase
MMQDSISEVYDLPKDLKLDEKVKLFVHILDSSSIRKLNLNSVAFTKIFFDVVTKDNKQYVKKAITHINRTGRFVARSSKNKRGRNVKIFKSGYQPEWWNRMMKIPVLMKKI